MKKIILPFLVLTVIAGMLAIAAPVFAQADPQVVQLDNPIKGSPGITIWVGQIIKTLLGIIGSLTFVVVIYGGFLWLTSSGQSDKVKKGLNTMGYAAIGLFIIFSSYAILTAVLNAITQGS